MLTREYRLRKKYQFNYVYRAGKSLASKNLILYFCPSKNKNVKVGISVSKKLGNAVVRNRTKRRIREIVMPFLEKLKPNFNLIVIAKESSKDANFAELGAQFEMLLKKTNLLKD